MKLTERDEADLKRLCELERVGRADAVRRAVFFRLRELEPEKAMLAATDARELNDFWVGGGWSMRGMPKR